jgi:hypothetical protein
MGAYNSYYEYNESIFLFTRRFSPFKHIFNLKPRHNCCNVMFAVVTIFFDFFFFFANFIRYLLSITYAFLSGPFFERSFFEVNCFRTFDVRIDNELAQQKGLDFVPVSERRETPENIDGRDRDCSLNAPGTRRGLHAGRRFRARVISRRDIRCYA